jgi:ribonuclease Z
MKKSKKSQSIGLTRRDLLKASGLALGGLALGGVVIGSKTGKARADQSCGCPAGPACDWTNYDASQRYTYFQNLDPFYPFNHDTKTTVTPLGENEMRITFMGSVIPMNMRKTQQEMSVFVEVGWDSDKAMPLDQFIFDCGSGVSTNYSAMNVSLGRMDKVFINHLHGDHMSDLTHIYCFGPSQDRKSPFYVFGPGNSGVVSPAYWGNKPTKYDDGTEAFCENLRRACRWHTESFSFQTTMYPGYPSKQKIKHDWGLPCMPDPVEDDPWGDAYAMVPIEFKWDKVGVAYKNSDTGVKITHFPVIHTRRGSVGYKLEWKTPRGEILSMIYTSDTKPEYNCVEQAINYDKKGHPRGVDVLIHEMIVPAQVWAMKDTHMDSLPGLDTQGVEFLTMVQNSSHSPQGGFGYLLSLIEPKPRLTVATHFPVADDTVTCATKSVREHFPNANVHQGNDASPDDIRITWSTDLMVIKVSKEEIVELKGAISDYEFSATINLPEGTPYPPKYSNPDGTGNPYAQIDRSTEIPSCNDGECNYRDDGY